MPPAPIIILIVILLIVAGVVIKIRSIVTYPKCPLCPECGGTETSSAVRVSPENKKIGEDFFCNDCHHQWKGPY